VSLIDISTHNAQLGGVAASSITPIATLMPAQAGADKTASNTAYDVVHVNGVASSTISPIATLMPAQAGADVTLQNVAAGSAITDTRAVNSMPSYYRALGQGVRHEFKQASTIGCPSSAAFVPLETKVQWHDTSGGVVTQEVNAADGVWVRKGSTDDTTWGSWYKSYDVQNKPDFANSDVLNPRTQYLTESGGAYFAAEHGANITSGHVLTSTVSPPNVQVITTTKSKVGSVSLGQWFGWSVNVSAAANDVYNISAVIVLSAGSAASSPIISVMVDGVTTAGSWSFPVSASGQTVYPFVCSVSGLTAGAHAIQFYAVDPSGNNPAIYATSYAICQRVY
jgi:hypothetical protein